MKWGENGAEADAGADCGEPRERLLGALASAAIPEAVALEDRNRGGEAAPRLPHRHRRRNQTVRLGHLMRRLQVREDLFE